LLGDNGTLLACKNTKGRYVSCSRSSVPANCLRETMVMKIILTLGAALLVGGVGWARTRLTRPAADLIAATIRCAKLTATKMESVSDDYFTVWGCVGNSRLKNASRVLGWGSTCAAIQSTTTWWRTMPTTYSPRSRRSMKLLRGPKRIGTCLMLLVSDT